MKSRILLLSLALYALMSCAQVQQGHEMLFNGHDLTGWVAVTDTAAGVSADDVFSVGDGCITVAGKPFGYLRTEKVYTDYKLHVEWRWVGEGTNSGIFQRIRPGDGLWPDAIECQLKAGNAGDFVCLGRSRLAEVDAGPDVMFPVKKRNSPSGTIENPDGEWNTAEIICEGKKITVYINGSLENEGTAGEVAGYIALQSEGGPLEFRNIYIEEKCSRATSLPRGEKDAALSEAVDRFIEATETVPQAPQYLNLHSIMILKHGQVMEERWLNGAGPDIPHPMWSVSKTFTSAAVGLAVSEGAFSIDDKVISFFPDQLPDTISDNLAAMTVKDLLTMTCGHDSECMGKIGAPGCDWVTAFLAHPVDHAPGTYYLYNSVGTYMLSAIVQKTTGEKVLDYLDTRLFTPLGIDRPWWDESPRGINCGGWGLYVKTEDMAKLGQLLLQGGVWNSEQILPAEWVKEMTSRQVPCVPSGVDRNNLEALGYTTETSDWMQGYGYQMWMCRHGAFRADGANGQYIIVFPERDAVLVLTTDSNMYQPYLDIVWEYLLPVL